MLSSAHRLREKNDFASVYRKGRRVGSKNLSISYVRNGQNNLSRFGFVVSKKRARRIVDRNRIKRRLRAKFAKLIAEVNPGFDVVVTGSGDIASMPSDQLDQELSKLIVKTPLWSK